MNETNTKSQTNLTITNPEPQKKIQSRNLRVNDVAKLFNVSTRSIIRWTDNGKLNYVRTIGGQRTFNYDECMRIISQTSDKTCTNVFNKSQKENIIYIRVSSRKQREDLERQQTYLVNKFPGYRVVSDIGSGINFKRKGFLSILEQVKENKIQRVVVASRDRLCRFGFELVEWFFKTFDTELLVLQPNDTEEDTLSQDVLSIIQVFNCRNNGRRRYKDNKMSKDKNVDKLST